MHAQTLAVYRLLDELRARHPGVEIESCSSGGLRVDLEVLERTDRVWGSDVIDPLERQQIQRWTAQLLPPELVGSHVGAPRAHTTGRTHDLSFRAGTALFGSFGIEWDLTTATRTPSARSWPSWVALYKEVRELLHTGTVVRAAQHDPSFAVHGVVAPDRSDALFALVQLVDAGDLGARRRAAARAGPGAALPRRSCSRPATGPPMRGPAPPDGSPRASPCPARSSSTSGLRAPALFPEQLLLVRVRAADWDGRRIRATAAAATGSRPAGSGPGS